MYRRKLIHIQSTYSLVRSILDQRDREQKFVSRCTIILVFLSLDNFLHIKRIDESRKSSSNNLWNRIIFMNFSQNRWRNYEIRNDKVRQSSRRWLYYSSVLYFLFLDRSLGEGKKRFENYRGKNKIRFIPCFMLLEL